MADHELTDEIIRLNEVIALLVTGVEWIRDVAEGRGRSAEGGHVCRLCAHYVHEGRGHGTDCPLPAALYAVDEARKEPVIA